MASQSVPDGQRTLLGDLAASPPSVRPVAGKEAAGVQQPVARIAVDVPLAHLDHLFDYRITPEQDAAAQVGARVQVRFAGKDRSGYVIARQDTTEHSGQLAPLRRVVSDLPVLTSDVRQLCRTVADRYAGTFADVVRLAVPPRHAATERSVREASQPVRTGQTSSHVATQAQWDGYSGAPAFLSRLATGSSPRAVWDAVPDAGGAMAHATKAIAEAAAPALASGRDVLVVVPSAHFVTALQARFRQELPDEPVAVLSSDDGPAKRYRAFLTVLLGRRRLVVGTRSAAFAPLPRPGLLVCFDDGNDLLSEPRAPYPNIREVLALRAAQQRCGLLVGGWSRSVETTAWLAAEWAQSLSAPRAVVRQRTARVAAPGEADLARHGAAASARIPPPAWRLVKDGLANGPVLVQTALSGYLPTVACQECREVARCPECHGPMQLSGRRNEPSCRWCGHVARPWRCPTCGESHLRAVSSGSGRTAEELGRAFPSMPVAISGARADGGVITEVDDRSRLVVTTPGAEPRAEGGYAAALLLDGAAATGRHGLNASVEALRRWLGAAVLVRPATEGGRVMLLGEPAPGPAQALVRWDPAGLAEGELAERRELHLPPAARMASLSGPRSALASFLTHLQLPTTAEQLGPVALDEDESRAVVRVPLTDSVELTSALQHAAALRSAHKEPGTIRVRVDPLDL